MFVPGVYPVAQPHRSIISFVDEEAPERLDDDAKPVELIYRTPGYFSAQAVLGPVHCNDFCKLPGETNWEAVKPMLGDLYQMYKLHSIYMW